MAAPKGNKFALGNTWGRPRYYETCEELAAKILDYITYCEGDYHEEEHIVYGTDNQPTGQKQTLKVCDRPPEGLTITGLCLFLGFESRSSFDKQAERDEDFSYIVKRAKMVVENRYEHGLSGNNPTGPIFALKNMGWKDKQEIDNTHSFALTWNETKTYEAEPKADPGP